MSVVYVLYLFIFHWVCLCYQSENVVNQICTTCETRMGPAPGLVMYRSRSKESNNTQGKEEVLDWMSSDISSSRPLEESAFSVRQKSVAYSMNLNKVTKILQFSLTGTLINVRSQSIQLLLRQFSQKPQMSTLARVTGKVMGSSKSLGLILLGL